MNNYRYRNYGITRGRPNRFNSQLGYRNCGSYYRNNYSNMYDVIEGYNQNNRTDYTTTVNMDRRGRIRNVVFNTSYYNNRSYIRYSRRRYLR